MKKKLRFISILVSVCMLVSSLAACSNSSSSDQTTESEEQTDMESEAQETADPMDYSAAKIDWRQCEGDTIRVLFNKHFYTDAIQRMLPEFEELTGIEVQFETYPEGEYYNKMLIELNGAANPPDVFMLDYATVVQYEEGGWLEDLTPYIENTELTDQEWYDFDDFMPSALELGTVDQTLYGLPVTGEWEILYYRKDLYEEKGLEVPETFDELYENAKILNTEDMSGFVARCARNSSLFWPWGGFVRSYDGQWVDENRTPMLNTPETVAATDMYAKLLRDTGPEGIVNYSWYEALTDFQQGKAAHFIDSSGFMANVEEPEKSLVAGKVGYALLPAAEPGGKSVPNLAHWMVGMGKDSKHKESAYLFLQWATCKKVALDVAINDGTSARTSLWSNEEFLSQYPAQWVDVSLESSENASKTCLNLLKEVWELGEVLEIAVNEICDGADTQQAMDKAQQESEKILTASE